MARRRVNTTKLEIIQTATRMFLKNGYSATSIKAIANALDMSTGHLTFYFPAKENLLAELVDMLCNFQWALMKQHVEEGESEENELTKDFFISAYTHALTLEIIRKNDAQRAKLVFAEYCPGWSDRQFAEVETLVSGIEYATLMTTDDSVPIDMRISGALNSIMMLYQVPEEIRRQKIQRVLAMDYRAIGCTVLQEFMAYIEETNEQAFEELLRRN